jgi:hypothetical protein
VLARTGRSGLQLDGEWYCSPSCLRDALRRRFRRDRRQGTPRGATPLAPIKLGVLLLVGQNTLTPTLLSNALDEQRRSGLRIGAQLQQMGLVSSQDVLRALAAQAGTSYLASVDVEPLTHAPGNLSRSAVQALGLVPIEVDLEKQVIKVAATAPLPRLAIGALRELTGFMVEPYLVADELWPSLLANYGTAQAAALRATAPPVRTLQDAAGRIVDAARRDPGVHLTHVRWDPYVWMRVEGQEHIEDLVLPVDEGSEDDTWAPGPTSH